MNKKKTNPVKIIDEKSGFFIKEQNQLASKYIKKKKFHPTGNQITAKENQKKISIHTQHLSWQHF